MVHSSSPQATAPAVRARATEDKSYVIVGRLGRSYGLEGWQHVQSFTHPIKNIFEYKRWFILQRNEWQPITVERSKMHGKSWIVQLSGIQQKEQAALLANKSVAVLRSELPTLPDGEFYWSDLEGLAVVTTEGVALGTVDYLYENTGLDIMVIKSKEKERHIPFVWKETIVSIDLSSKLITLDWDFDLS